MSQAIAENKVPPWERDWAVSPSTTGQPKKPWERDWGQSEMNAVPQTASRQESVRAERTWGEALGDTAVQLAEGVNTVAGAVPSLMAPEGRAAEFFRDNADYWRDRQSPTLKARIAKADEAITVAGEDGVISQIVEAAGQYFNDPALAARFVTTNLPSMIPSIGAAKLAQAAALAKGASALKAASVATTAAGATNSVLNAGGARGEAFEDIKRTLEAQGYSPEQAEQMALSDSRVAAAVGAAAGFLSGKTGLEGSIVGKTGTGGALRAGGRAAAAELAGEQIEEVAPKLTTNLLASQYDDRSLGQDVGRTIVETAIGSGPGAIAAGGATALNTRAQNQASARSTAPEVPTGDKPASGPPAAQDLGAPGVITNETLRAPGGSKAQVVAPAKAGPKPAPIAPTGARPEARLAELDIVQLYRPLNTSEIDEKARLLDEIGERNARAELPISLQEELAAQNAQADRAPPAPGRQAAAPAQPQVTESRVLPVSQPASTLSRPAASILPESQPNAAASMVTPVAPVPQAGPLMSPERQAELASQGVDPALQNRDRSRAASVAQMSEIARNPDYLRLATSRTPDAGAPMVFAVGDDIGAIPQANIGRADIAVMADGQRVPFLYAVVDASRVQPSNFADGRVNPSFGAQTIGSLKALNNGRTAGLRAAYEMGTTGNYQAELIADAAAHGVAVEAIQQTPNPVLVRVYSEKSNTPNMAAKSQGQGLGMSPTELAREDAPRIDSSVLSVYQPGDVGSAANRDFVRAFVGRLGQAGQDVAGMMTADGTLSPAGRQRIQAALMQAAYGDADLVTELFESLDTDIKTIGESLKAVAGEWANMRDSARQGLINPQADVTDNLVQAIQLIRKAKRDNTMVYDLVQQPDLMTGETPDAITAGLLRLFYRGNFLTRPVGREALTEALRDYVQSAMGTNAGADMFGEQVTPSDILSEITVQGASNAQDSTQEGGRGADGSGLAGPGTSPARQENPGQRRAEGGPGAGQDSRGSGEGASRQVFRGDAEGAAGPGNAQAAQGDQASRLDADQPNGLESRLQNAEATNALRREALPIVRAQAFNKKGITYEETGGITQVLFKGQPIAQVDGKPTRDKIVKAIEAALAEPEPLSSYTPGEVLARQDAAQLAERQDEVARQRADTEERQRTERKEVERLSRSAADNFELGQDPLDSLTGQRSVFDEPALASSPARQSQAGARKPSSAGKIADVGEQLYANRRNFTGRGIKWEDVEGLNDTLKVKEVTKAKAWPRPNYDQLVAEGMPPVLARLVKHVYDGLSAGPTLPSGNAPTDADLQRYLNTLAKVREGLFGFINDRQVVADFAQGALTMVKGEPTSLGPISILDMSKEAMSPKDISTVLLRRVWPERFAADVPTVGRFARGTDAQRELSILGGNKALAALQFDRTDITRWMTDLSKGWPAKREAWQVQGYRVLAPGEYTAAGQEQSDGTTRMNIRPKQGRGSWRAVFTDAQMTNPPFLLVQDGGFSAEGFGTREAAIEAAREKVKRAPTAGQDLRGTNIEEAERTGPARRQDGEDITPQRLMETFGFRGVNFGREGWIKQDERQEYLNQAFDGLMDLADILGIPPQAISLDGKLGVAFGAQGKGGAHAAHFVPGYNEINLTKTKGAGTLAHEWGHAMDHHFATLAGLDKDPEPYLSEHASQPDQRDRMVFEDGRYVRKTLQTFGEGIRPEIVQAFRSIYQAMDKRSESAGEAGVRRKEAKARAEKSLDSWLKAARRAIEDSPAGNKKDLLAEFDQHAEKFREGDTGDGHEKAGKQMFTSRTAAVRNLIKDATGRLWSMEDTSGLDHSASYLKSLLGKELADAAHEPQKVATQYKRDSLAMDKEKGGKAYWGTPTEMLARAFELYVHDKLAQRGQRNTFLTDADLRANKPVQIPDESSAMARGAGAMRDLYLYPIGKERETLREAFDSLVGQLKTKPSDKGLMLYEPEGSAYTGDTNEPLESNRRADRNQGSGKPGLAAAVAMRGTGGAVSGRARITALGIAADIERVGSAALVGQTVGSADELAQLAQVYRDPRYETFRVFFTRKNLILHATGVSARLPGQAPMVPAGMTSEEYVQLFKDQMQTAGADGYYILHNHPSGDPTPSRQDQEVTEYLAAQVPGLRAHVVINSNRFAVMRPGAPVEVKSKDFGPDLLRIPSLPSPVLNAAIGSPDDLATLGKSLQKPGWLTLIGTDSGNRVRLTADIPASALSREPRVLAGQVRRLMRQSGSRNMHLVGSDADVASRPVQDALREGILRDAIGNSGQSQAQRGMAGWGPGFSKTAGRFVAEEGGRRATPRTDTPEFKRWFGDSKVVDAAGKPLVVYHGTAADVEFFDPLALGINTQARSARGGFFFAASPTVASGYAMISETRGMLRSRQLRQAAEVETLPEDLRKFLQDAALDAELSDDSVWMQSEAGGGITGSNVLPVYLSIQNPLVVDYGGQEYRELSYAKAVAEARAGGHDGLVLRNTEDSAHKKFKELTDIYVAFQPEQIKSATGNRGTFDPTDRSIVREDEPGYQRNSLGDSPPPQPGPEQETAWTRAKAKVMQLTSPEAIEKLIYEFQDKYIDLKRLRDHIKELGGTITDLNDAYLGEELYHKRLAKRTEDFLDKELKPLLADMRSRSVSLPELERYLHARHAPEANRVLAARNPTRAQIDSGKAESARTVRDLEIKLQRARAQGSATKAIEDALEQAREEAATWNGAQAFRGTEEERLALSGMSDAEAQAFMASLTPRQRENFQELAAKVDQIQAETLDALENYGLMDRATINAWRNTYEFYVPLHRDEARPESDRHPIGQGFSVKGSAVKSRTGSNEKVTNILTHIAMQREATLTRGEKNHVVKRLYLMAAQNPDEEFWEIDSPPQIKSIDSRTGFVRTGIDPGYKNRANVVMVRIAGRDQAIVFNEHNPQAVRLAESMKNLDVGDLHVVLGLAAKGTRWFASVNTQYNPIFGLINFARDVQAGLLNLSTTELAGKTREVASHVLPAMRAIYRERRGKRATNGTWAQLWEEFQDVGGTTGYRDLFTDAQDRANALARELKALDRGAVAKAAWAVVDWLSDYNETMENAVRLSAYKVALEQGLSKERAASLAKNITVNFNRKGRQTREIGALYAFFNAALQGTARMVETLRGPIGKRIMYGGVMLGVVNTLVGMAVMGGDDEDEADNWEQIPQFIKERSIVIPLGREDYFTIPMPLGFHVFPNIGRIATEFAFGGSEKTLGSQVGQLMLAVVDAFNPLGGSQNLGQLVSPTVIDPVVALMQNKDWTGKPIYRENANGLDPQPGHRMAKDAASTPSRVVAEAINNVTGGTDYRPGAWSPTPDQLDYVIGQLTGGLGRELLKVNQTLSSTVTGDELPPYKIPLVGRLYGNTRGPAGQSGKYYENIRLLNEIENEFKGRLRNREDVNEFRESEPLVKLIGMGNNTENVVRRLREQRRRLVERQDPGYQERVKEIDVRIGEVMGKLNQEVAKVRREATQ